MSEISLRNMIASALRDDPWDQPECVMVGTFWGDRIHPSRSHGQMFIADTLLLHLERAEEFLTDMGRDETRYQRRPFMPVTEGAWDIPFRTCFDHSHHGGIPVDVEQSNGWSLMDESGNGEPGWVSGAKSDVLTIRLDTAAVAGGHDHEPGPEPVTLTFTYLQSFEGAARVAQQREHCMRDTSHSTGLLQLWLRGNHLFAVMFALLVFLEPSPDVRRPCAITHSHAPARRLPSCHPFFPVSFFPFPFHFLLTGMGTAKYACSGGCTCDSGSINSLKEGSQIAVAEYRAVNVTQAHDCIVTLGNEGGGLVVGGGGGRFKLLGVTLSTSVKYHEIAQRHREQRRTARKGGGAGGRGETDEEEKRRAGTAAAQQG